MIIDTGLPVLSQMSADDSLSTVLHYTVSVITVFAFDVIAESEIVCTRYTHAVNTVVACPRRLANKCQSVHLKDPLPVQMFIYLVVCFIIIRACHQVAIYHVCITILSNIIVWCHSQRSLIAPSPLRP